MLSMILLNEIRARLSRVLGQERAEELIREVLAEIGLAELVTADDLLAFGKALGARGGMLRVVGNALKTQAVLRGATAATGAEPDRSGR
jgi:hypothetical protein